MAVRIPVELAHGLDALRAGASEQATVAQAALHIFLFGAAIIVVRTASRLWFFTPARVIEFDLREDLFAQFLALQPDFYASFRTGDLLSRATTDITFARAFAGFATLQGANIIAALITALGQMAAFSPKLTALAAIPIGIGFLVVQQGSARLMTLQRDTQQQQGMYADQLLGALQGISTVQAFNVEGPFADRLAAQAGVLRQNNVALAKLRALVFPLFTVSGGIAIGLLLGFGGQMVLEGQLSAGALAAFLSLVAYLIMPLRLMGFLLPVFQRAEASLERIHAIFDAPISRPERGQPDLNTKAQPAQANQVPALSVQHLNFAYPGGAAALVDLSFEVPAGGSLGIFGRSGSGKSTLLRVLSRLHNPPAGTVTVDGRDLTSLDLDDWRRHVVFVPQTAWLFSETIAENIALGLPRETLEPAVEAAALKLDLAALPNGIETVVGERGIVLSGGQRQRVALARGLAHASDGGQSLLLFDDVLSAVDHHTEQILIRTLLGREQSSSKPPPTCIIVTHRMSALQHCDRVLVLDGGRAVAYGTHAELLGQPGFYQDSWHAQQGTA
jgi:ATP-binding cassette subfamily B protein